jgi:transcriptional regulator with XRE-family HTH domain
MNFGPFIKQLRIEKRLTLRNFCQELGLDPSNWSKVERGINPPPRDSTALQKLADFFDLDGDERQELFDAAAVARSEIPGDLAAHDLLAAKLPAFFRSIRGTDPDDRKLRELIRELRKLHTSDQSGGG